MPSPRQYQIEDALAERIRRLEAVRLCGIMDGLPGQRVVLVNDDGGTASSVAWNENEPLKAVLDRLDERYAKK